jgi:hypothetical protein
MSFMFPSAPPPPPPPPAPPQLGQPSIAEQGAAERQALANAQGAGSNGTDVTGGQGAAAPTTTKTLLGA